MQQLQGLRNLSQSIVKKKEKKHDQIVLLVKSKLSKIDFNF